MKSAVIRGVLAGLLVCGMAAAATAQATRTISGTVVEVAGNTLVVKMASGDVRVFTPPADRKFIVDGKELTLNQLQPGTNLKATITETATTVVDRTVQTLEGTVIFASGPSVILRDSKGETKLYTIKKDDPVKFRDGSGKEITVFDLRKDMKINATKITEAPRTELVATAVVTGTGPKAASAGAASGSGAGTGSGSGAGAGAAKPAATETMGGRTASQTAMTAPGDAPKKLPKTASPLPLLGLTGLASLLTGLGLTLRRRATR